VGGLKAGESIEVSKVVYPDRGEIVARNYRITGGNVRRFDAVALSTSWSGSELQTKDDHAVCSFPLSPEQEEGLDAVLTYYRQHKAEVTLTRREYRFTYYRNGKVIGQELVLGYGFIDRLTYFAQERSRGLPVENSEYEYVAKQLGWSTDVIQRMVTLEMLEESGRAERS
jgi:hypothetical protein